MRSNFDVHLVAVTFKMKMAVKRIKLHWLRSRARSRERLADLGRGDEWLTSH